MASKSELINSKAVSQLSDREIKNVLDDWLERVMWSAQAFKFKVEREAPKCFQPSKELKELFDVLDEEF